MKIVENKQRERRQFIKVMMAGVSYSGVMLLTGCNNGDSTQVASQSSSATTGAASSNSADIVVSSDGWASGGTANMTVDFPDDSLFEQSQGCTVSLTESQTEGPCYFQSDYLDDISEEQTGLPMQLCLQLTDSACNPLSGYEIEVWHCDVNGLYSGQTDDSADATRFNSGFCTGNDAQALAARWFRGIQVTDSSGRVNFKTCFPGWYASRAIHIHFRVRRNNNDEVVSQLGFSDAFCQEICTSHVDYAARGEPDTTQASDTVFDSSDDSFLLTTQQNEDGSLLGYHRIMIAG